MKHKPSRCRLDCQGDYATYINAKRHATGAHIRQLVKWSGVDASAEQKALCLALRSRADSTGDVDALLIVVRGKILGMANRTTRDLLTPHGKRRAAAALCAASSMGFHAGVTLAKALRYLTDEMRGAYGRSVCYEAALYLGWQDRCFNEGRTEVMTRKKARRRIARLLRHIGLTFAEAVQDARTLVARGRNEPLATAEKVFRFESSGCDCCGDYRSVVGLKGSLGTVTIDQLIAVSHADLW